MRLVWLAISNKKKKEKKKRKIKIIMPLFGLATTHMQDLSAWSKKQLKIWQFKVFTATWDRIGSHRIVSDGDRFQSGFINAVTK